MGACRPTTHLPYRKYMPNRTHKDGSHLATLYRKARLGTLLGTQQVEGPNEMIYQGGELTQAQKPSILCAFYGQCVICYPQSYPRAATATRSRFHRSAPISGGRCPAVVRVSTERGSSHRSNRASPAQFSTYHP